MFGQKQTLVLHLFTTANSTLPSTFGRALCVTSLGLSCYPDGTGHRFAGCLWRETYLKCWKKSLRHSGETCGSSTTGLRLALPVRSENISPPLTAITGLEGSGLWLVLPGHRTSHQWTSSYGATLKTLIFTSPVNSEDDLIARIADAAATTRAASWHF